MIDPDPVVHHPDCNEPDLTRKTGALGDTLDVCRSCRRFAVVDPTAPPPEPAPVATKYVCRPHGHPVTPKGKGCKACRREQHRHRTRRRRRRAAPEVDETEELWTQ